MGYKHRRHGYNRLESSIREEMAVILANYIKAKGLNLPEKAGNEPFSDSDELDSYAAEAITDMRRFGLINGRGNNYYVPKGMATRAEVAQIFLNLLNL